jgi:hypothetical protein
MEKARPESWRVPLLGQHLTDALVDSPVSRTFFYLIIIYNINQLLPAPMKSKVFSHVMLTQFVAEGKDSAGRQGARPEMAKRPTFENETLLADRHFHSPFQDQYEIVGSFSLFDEVRNGASGGNKKRKRKERKRKMDYSDGK